MTFSAMGDSWRRALRQLASLRLAVVMLAALAAVLAGATFYESAYGTPAAQRDVYGSWWFAVILLMLAVNVAAATIQRIPWRPRHIGFVVTHAAVLLILGGCLATHWAGVNGKITIAEGHQESLVEQDGWLLVVFGPEDRQPPKAIVPIGSPVRVGQAARFEVDGRPYSATIAQYMPDARLREQIVAGGATDPAGVLVDLTIAGQAMSRWLIVDDATDQWSVRMPGFSLAAGSEFVPPRVPADLPSKGRLLVTLDGREYPVDVAAAMEQSVPLGDGRTTVRVTEFYEHADVSEGKLGENAARPTNPAVVVELTDGDRIEHRIVFARYGDVSMMRRDSQVGPARLVYQHPGAAESDVNLLLVPKDGVVTLYELAGSKLLQQVSLSAGKPVALKGQEMSLTLQEFQPHARATAVVQPASPSEESHGPAMDVQLDGPDLHDRGWLVQGYLRVVPAGSQPLRVVLQPRRFSLPFALRLERFDVEYYPNTQMPRLYRSRVTVLDTRGQNGQSVAEGGESAASQPAAPTVDIEMNRPLEHAGWTVFQSSFSQGPDGGFVTVLSVSRDPGKPLVYLGAILLVLGTIILAIQRFVAIGQGPVTTYEAAR